MKGMNLLRLRTLNQALLLPVIFSLICPPARAADTSDISRYLGEDQPDRSASEYSLRNFPDEKLISVRLLGGVNRPGLYHIPVGTDLMTLISLSGGLTQDAKLDDILVKRPSRKSVLKVDLKEVVASPELPGPALEGQDVVLIRKDEPWVSSNTLASIGLVSSLVGVILSGVLVAQQFKK